MIKELNHLAKVVDLNQVLTLLANENDLSVIALLAGLRRSNFKIITVFVMPSRHKSVFSTSKRRLPRAPERCLILGLF